MNIYCWQILGRGQGVNPRVCHVIPLMFEGVGVRSSSVPLLILGELVRFASLSSARCRDKCIKCLFLTPRVGENILI